ncbi:MAG: cytidylate kinase family protein [Pseudomonadota bacterium]
MTIVMISSLYQSGSEELAQALARKTQWPVLDRKTILDKARNMGIRIGRLETAVVKSPGLPEKLSRDRDLYLALVTETLCEKALEGHLIYHGLAGHLMLPGITHRLRVGLTAPFVVRLNRAAAALNVTPERAVAYLKSLDEDVAHWMKFIHRIDGSTPNHFDAVFNLETMGLANAADILCSMKDLPEFAPTQASKRLLKDTYLTSRAKLRLAMDEKTAHADLQIQADNGALTVTYPPQQEGVREHIPGILETLEGCREIRCTMAETNILWVQERFEPESDNFRRIIQLAQRWGAAVEMLRLMPPGEQTDNALQARSASNAFARPVCAMADNGGVEDDDPESPRDDGGLDRTQEALVALGRSGGRHTVCGGYERILETARGDGRYALVVIGNMFLSKGHSTRTRCTRELAMSIRDRLKAPVITEDELKTRFLFGKRQAFTLAGFLAAVLIVYGLVFTHQDAVLAFLSGPLHQRVKWLAPLVVAIFVPVLAYIYGEVAGLALKIINID